MAKPDFSMCGRQSAISEFQKLLPTISRAEAELIAALESLNAQIRRIHAEASRLDAGARVKICAGSLPPEKLKLRKELSSKARLQKDGSFILPPNFVFVERLECGEIAREALSAEETEQILRRKFDLVVDELRDLVKIPKARERQDWILHEISPVFRGLLWLILTHVGRPLSYAEIAKLFGFSCLTDISARDNRIHQYRLRLRERLLGDLCREIFGKGVNKLYPIKKAGWSFCWVREQADTATSALVHELPGRPSENQ